MKYMPDGVRVVKDNLFAPPEIFDPDTEKQWGR
jgi:hypothetical protein